MEYLAVIDKPVYNACFRTQAVVSGDEYVVSQRFLSNKGVIDYDDELLMFCEVDTDTYKETLEHVLTEVQVMLEYLEWMTEQGVNFVELLSDMVEFNADLEEYLFEKGLSPNYMNVRFNKILL